MIFNNTLVTGKGESNLICKNWR